MITSQVGNLGLLTGLAGDGGTGAVGWAKPGVDEPSTCLLNGLDGGGGGTGGAGIDLSENGDAGVSENGSDVGEVTPVPATWEAGWGGDGGTGAGGGPGWDSRRSSVQASPFQ